MVGRSLLMLSLLATLSLSGCLDGDSGEADTESLDAAPEGDGKATDAGKAAAPAPDVADVVPTPFSWDGSLGYTVGGCAVVTCQGTGFGAWDSTRDVTGITGGELTLTWDLPTELGFGLATRCDGPCDFVTSTYGASPQAISFDGLDPDRTYVLVAWHPYRSETGLVGTQVGVETEIHVDGTVMAV